VSCIANSEATYHLQVPKGSQRWVELEHQGTRHPSDNLHNNGKLSGQEQLATSIQKGVVEGEVEIRDVNDATRLSNGILHDDISSECTARRVDPENLSVVLETVDPAHEGVDNVLDDRLEFPHLTHGEELVQCRLAHPVNLVEHGGKGGLVGSKPTHGPVPLVPSPTRSGIKHIIELGRQHVDLVGVDTDDRSVFLV
jgi:hypothetical protein